MLRKLLIAGVASLAMLSPLAIPAESEAHEMQASRRGYCVLYRTCAHERWREAAHYRYRSDAFRAARILQHRGFETMIRH